MRIDLTVKQMGIRHRFIKPRTSLSRIDRMLHARAGEIGLPQMASWANELEACADELHEAAAEMRRSARCCAWCGPPADRRHCRLLAGHLEDCVP